MSLRTKAEGEWNDLAGSGFPCTGTRVEGAIAAVGLCVPYCALNFYDDTQMCT